MEAFPLRVAPNMDLRNALESAVAARLCRAAFLISGIGSLRQARLRLANAAEPDALHGDLEILTLAGTVASNGSHLHMSVANAEGRVFGGHVAYGCTVRTTAEVLLLLLPEWSFTRELDPTTGFEELVVHRER
jgi:predicted DNA-binding protein with PD1-like motif